MINVSRSIREILFRAVKLFFTGQWYIGIKRIGKSYYSGKAYKKIIPPKGKFYADPFIFKKGNLNYIFYEDYSYESDKGIISCLSMDDQGVIVEYPGVLEREYHLSYPFIFECRKQVYMIPETSANKTVELYRATNFPKGWVLEKVLIKDISAVDATIIKNNGLYWLFAGVLTEGGEVNTNLNLYYSESLCGEWIPHPCNPIVSDKSRARPAGKLFYQGDELMRPGQDCSLFYGRAVWIHRVEVLNKTDYREVKVRKIKPSLLSGDLGLHTYNFNEELEVVDCKVIARKSK